MAGFGADCSVVPFLEMLLDGSSALLMKLACLVRNDRMRDEVAN
jgi:hypothetical protein